MHKPLLTFVILYYNTSDNFH